MTLEPLISAQEIQEKISQVAQKINAHYEGQELTLIMVMKGSICLAADLIRSLTIPLSIEYIRAKSYGTLGMIRGELILEGLEDLDIASKNVLLVDDIFDSGNTLSQIMSRLQEKNPKSLQSLVLLAKKHERSITYLPDQILFWIDPVFVVGYGLDYKEHYRNLPAIYILKDPL